MQDTIQRNATNDDFDPNWGSVSEILPSKSPSGDLSAIDASFNLVDERVITGERDDRQSVHYMVETGLSADERTGTVNFLISRFFYHH